MSFQTVLQDILPEKHSLPGSETYEKSNEAYFTVFESGIQPAAIAGPTSAEEVGKLVKRLGEGSEGGVGFAVKGTGHTPFAGTLCYVLPYFLDPQTTEVLFCFGGSWLRLCRRSRRKIELN